MATTSAIPSVSGGADRAAVETPVHMHGSYEGVHLIDLHIRVPPPPFDCLALSQPTASRMTCSLRKRVQKQFVSPLITRSKELHTEGGTCMQHMNPKEGIEATSSRCVEPTLDALPYAVQCSGELRTLLEERRALQLQLEMMKERRRKLQMVKTYHHKVCSCTALSCPVSYPPYFRQVWMSWWR